MVITYTYVRTYVQMSVISYHRRINIVPYVRSLGTLIELAKVQYYYPSTVQVAVL